MIKNEAGLYEVDVDGKTYAFEKWGADESLDVLIDLSQIIGGPVGQAIGNVFTKDGMDSEINAGMLGVAIDGLMRNMKKDVVKPLVKKLASEKVLCDGKPIKFNTHYQDDLFHMFRVVKSALEVQYGNFFAGFQGVVGIRKKRHHEEAQAEAM